KDTQISTWFGKGERNSEYGESAGQVLLYVQGQRLEHSLFQKIDRPIIRLRSAAHRSQRSGRLAEQRTVWRTPVSGQVQPHEGKPMFTGQFRVCWRAVFGCPTARGV